MTENLEIHCYLAGPDVFYPNAKEIGEAKKAKLAVFGIKGHFPFDNELSAKAFRDPHEASNAIGKANEQMMLTCFESGRLGIILVNMTPFRGPSMDVGTSFEVGFMSALAEFKNNIVIIGYSDDQRLFEDRVIDDFYGRQGIAEKNDFLYGPDGMKIDAYGGAENLMITHAIEKTGGGFVKSFDEAVALARKLADAR
jgi:nucleoside 2-deoxyribosyltransferase